MAAPDLSPVWVANPELVTSAIKLLAGAVFILCGALVSVILYVWHDHKNNNKELFTKLETKIDGFTTKFAEGLTSLANSVEHRLTAIEARCDERECSKEDR